MLLQSVVISIRGSLDIVINVGTRRSHVDNETSHVIGVSIQGTPGGGGGGGGG
jgi:hypothetical protein